MGLALTALASGAVSWLALRQPEPPTLTASQSAPCQPVPRVVYAYDQGSAVEVAGGYDLRGNSVLSLGACRPGVLTFDASGVAAAGSGPRVTVTLGSEPLLDVEVVRPESIRVPVPHAGEVTIAYLNDYLRVAQRSVVLTGAQFRGACRGTLRARVGAGASFPLATSYRAAFAPPNSLTLLPCGPGTLTFTAEGTPARGQYPVLAVTGGTPRTLTLTASSTHTINAEGPVTLTVANPSYDVLEDRNLSLRRITLR